MTDKPSPVSITPQQLVSLRRDARHIKLAKGKIRARQSGAHMSKLRGRGMEFDQVRAYQQGDDIRSIDWRVTARTTEVHTKLYQEEKERPVLLCVDYRRSMHFATRGAFKSVIASRITALLAWSANLNGDRIGGLLFTEHEQVILKAQRGKHAVLDLFHRMSDLHADSAQQQRNSASLSNSLRQLRRTARPGSLVLIASDFHGLDEHCAKHIIELARHCEVTLISIHDPIEAQLPHAGLYRFKDGSKDVQVDTSRKQQREQHQQRFIQQQQSLQDLARKHRMHFVNCSTAADPIEQLREQLEVGAV